MLSVGVAIFQFWPDWVWILVIIGIFAIVQFIEGNILVPKIMSRQVGVSAVTVIVALLIGGELLGILGAILAVPTAAILQVIGEQFLKESEQTESPEGKGGISTR